MTIVNLTALTGLDEVFISSTGSFLNNTLLFVGRFGDTFDLGLRISVPIPQGSIINTADLSPTAFANESGVVVRTKFQAEAVDNAAQIVSNADFLARLTNLTVAVGTWDNIPAISINEFFGPSPDFASVIQEIINRPGWVSGNHINLFWLDDGSDFLGRRGSRSVIQPPASVLTIDFGAAPTGGISPLLPGFFF